MPTNTSIHTHTHSGSSILAATAQQYAFAAQQQGLDEFVIQKEDFPALSSAPRSHMSMNVNSAVINSNNINSNNNNNNNSINSSKDADDGRNPLHKFGMMGLLDVIRMSDKVCIC